MYKSTNFGANWTEIAGTSGAWTLACDDSGSTCVAGANPGSLSRSTDSGATWAVVPNTANQRWESLWCDPTGTTFVAAIFTFGSGLKGQIYKSTTGGASFTAMPNTANLERWGAVACDAAATTCIATARSGPFNNDPGAVYTTNDGFQTITVVPNSPMGISQGATVSLDGTKMIFTQFEDSDPPYYGPGFIWYSDDGGQTFEKTNVPRGYYLGIDCDAAFKMCAAGRNGDLNYDPVLMQTSCDGGRTWSEDPGEERYWTQVKVNADGGYMYSADDNNGDSWIYSFPLPV